MPRRLHERIQTSSTREAQNLDESWFLYYLGTNEVPMPTNWDVWHVSSVRQDSFWAMDNTMTLDATVYHTLFGDHREGKGVFKNSRSILRVRIEKAKGAWLELHFESKA